MHLLIGHCGSLFTPVLSLEQAEAMVGGAPAGVPIMALLGAGGD